MSAFTLSMSLVVVFVVLMLYTFMRSRHVMKLVPARVIEGYLGGAARGPGRVKQGDLR